MRSFVSGMQKQMVGIKAVGANYGKFKGIIINMLSMDMGELYILPLFCVGLRKIQRFLSLLSATKSLSLGFYVMLIN